MVVWRDISKQYEYVSRSVLISDINKIMGFNDNSFSKLRKLDLIKIYHFLVGGK